MKTLVVYYSRTGTTKILAEEIAKILNCEIEEIIDQKNRLGPIGFLSGGRDALEEKLTKIKPINRDLKKYDLVIVGSPVWTGRMAPALRTFLLEAKPKKVAAFCTMGAATPQDFFTNMKKISILPQAELYLSTKEVRSNNFNQKVKDFINAL
jgi:flavodoxin